MIVSGGQCPIRAAVGKRNVRRGVVRRGGLPGLLKNGPLCLAVYGGRDLAGLPSTDSHYARRVEKNGGGKGVKPPESRGKLAPTRARSRLLPSSVFPRSFCASSVLSAGKLLFPPFS